MVNGSEFAAALPEERLRPAPLLAVEPPFGFPITVILAGNHFFVARAGVAAFERVESHEGRNLSAAQGLQNPLRRQRIVSCGAIAGGRPSVAAEAAQTLRLGGPRAQGRQQIANAVPVRRIGRPEEIAALAVWLCSDQASYITGATISIDGGQLAGFA